MLPCFSPFCLSKAASYFCQGIFLTCSVIELQRYLDCLHDSPSPGLQETAEGDREKSENAAAPSSSVEEEYSAMKIEGGGCAHGCHSQYERGQSGIFFLFLLLRIFLIFPCTWNERVWLMERITVESTSGTGISQQ